MFVGHYGPSFAIKSARPSIPLWVLFIAVQLVDVGWSVLVLFGIEEVRLVDVGWSVLVLFGIEKVRIVPGITASNPLDLYYMPYTHSLVAAAIWAVAVAVLVRFFPGMATRSAAAWIGAAVFSHWVLDL